MVVLSGFLPLHSPAVCISPGLVHIPGSVPRGHFTLGRLEVVSAVGVGYLEVASGSLSLFPFSGLPYGAGLFLRFLLGLLSF